MSQPVGDVPRPSERERRSLDLEKLISQISSSFLTLPPGKVDREIEEAQSRVCELTGIDASILWQESTASPGVLIPTHYYIRGGAEAPEQMRREHFPYLSEQLASGEIMRIASWDELSSEAAIDRQHAELHGVRSILMLPISSGGRSPAACLAFSTTQAEREWPDALVNRLQLVAQAFGHALAQGRAHEALLESEERLSLAVESAEAGVWAMDLATGIFWAEARARAMFGFSPDEVITMALVEARVHPEDLGIVRAAIGQASRSDVPLSIEHRLITSEGIRWVSSRGRSHRSSRGEPERLMGVTIDVTDRKRAEEALVASEARLQAGAELAGLAFYELDFVARMAFADDRFRDLCGVPPDLEDGFRTYEFWMEHLHPDDAPHVIDARQQALDGKHDGFNIEYRYLAPGQEQKWIHHIARVAERDSEGHFAKSYGVLRDITERRRVEQELQDLSRRLMQAQEDERAFLARELHDDVSQRLAVLAINVGRAELAAPRGEQAEAMRAVREELVRLSDDVHSLAYQLHPAILEELGLAEALRTEGERHRSRGLHVWVHLDPSIAVLDDDLALCLFRVTQEALNNVTRHAEATVATVRLRQTGDGLLLAVSDNGVGFDPADPSTTGSLGLVSMRERARLVNGTLEIESEPGQGTTVIAWAPTNEAS